MAGPDELLGAIEAIYAAGLDAELWPHALATVTQFIGGVGTTLEIIDRASRGHRFFTSFGFAPVTELKYLEDYAAENPRLAPDLQRRPGEVSVDYEMFDEREMDRSAFYMKFLAPLDLRYVVGGILARPKSEFGVLAVQRSRRQGHADRSDVARMKSLLPHVDNALKVAWRLNGATRMQRSLEDAVNQLADGFALVRTDGAIVYANDALQAIARDRDGIAIRRNAFEFAGAAGSRFRDALGDIGRLLAGDIRCGSAEFQVQRGSDAPPYVVSIRPLRDREYAGDGAVALVLVRDPASRDALPLHLVRATFGLTGAEAALAQALQCGVSPGAYAKAHTISLNTVYTHLRRIKDKTGCHRMSELIRKLNELELPLRNDLE
jgi:DNA-binding CsgD family transcriptional regulator